MRLERKKAGTAPKAVVRDNSRNMSWNARAVAVWETYLSIRERATRVESLRE